MRKIIIIFFLSLIFFACQEVTAPSETVSVKYESARISITNNTDIDIFYTMFEKSILPYIDWIAICGENNKIKPTETKTISVTTGSFLPSNEAVIYWWHRGNKIENSDYYGADKILTLGLKIN
jgi:PBP1b-binding outer membrane lipoprotein LpoB